MASTLERYQRCSYGASRPAKDSQSIYQEYLNLKAEVEALQQSQRHFLGEDLGQLSTKELEHLERQLDSSLNTIRSTRTQYMLDQLSDLQQKEQTLLEVNNGLRSKLEECTASLQPSWEAGGNNMEYRLQPSQPDLFFEPLDCNHTLQIGYNPMASAQLNIATSTQNTNGIVPGWML
ncbi:unnamed protein product [Ilex paraguariensis]|uniref:K-box domain-containing protein n=1 Tax=Ilex paraguariensis TaxID=185542 RepID=A0ABC8RFW2_9AQUA